jgi:hypothetical protein
MLELVVVMLELVVVMLELVVVMLELVVFIYSSSSSSNSKVGKASYVE